MNNNSNQDNNNVSKDQVFPSDNNSSNSNLNVLDNNDNLVNTNTDNNKVPKKKYCIFNYICS